MFGKHEAIEIMNKYGAQKTPFFFVSDFEGNNFYIAGRNEAHDEGVYFNLNGISNFNETKLQVKLNKFEKHPISYRRYKKAFEMVLAQLYYGNSYLLNLTFPTQIETNLTLSEIFNASKAKYKLKFQDRFVVFSPETFIQIKENRIFTFPMKGTIDADIPDAENRILNDPKERAEHVTIVDLLRNDLGMVASKVRVDKFRYIDKIRTHQKNLLQVSSVISGNLPDDWNMQLGNLIEQLLPAGSISGAPKQKTVEIIKRAEGYDRGFYTGICGYFNGDFLDTGIMIRFIENIDNKLYYKSGGGITFMSNARNEYNELIDKVYVPFG